MGVVSNAAQASALRLTFGREFRHSPLDLLVRSLLVSEVSERELSEIIMTPRAA
jgi:hypothetical protein